MAGRYYVEQEVTKLFRIRRTVLEMLRDRGYVVLETNTDLDMSRDEFASRLQQANYARESLTLLKQHQHDPSDQIYVFFPAEERVSVKTLRDYFVRMDQERVYKAILVVIKSLSPFAKQEMELLVNITHHELVPKHEVLSAEGKKQLLKRYHLKESQLPRILITDPVARYFGLQKGQVVKITRPSETAGRYVTYRLVV